MQSRSRGPAPRCDVHLDVVLTEIRHEDDVHVLVRASDADGAERRIRFSFPTCSRTATALASLRAWHAQGTRLAYVVSGGSGRLIDEEDAFRGAFGYEDPWVFDETQ